MANKQPIRDQIGIMHVWMGSQNMALLNNWSLCMNMTIEIMQPLTWWTNEQCDPPDAHRFSRKRFSRHVKNCDGKHRIDYKTQNTAAKVGHRLGWMPTYWQLICWLQIGMTLQHVFIATWDTEYTPVVYAQLFSSVIWPQDCTSTSSPLLTTTLICCSQCSIIKKKKECMSVYHRRVVLVCTFTLLIWRRCTDWVARDTCCSCVA